MGSDRYTYLKIDSPTVPLVWTSFFVTMMILLIRNSKFGMHLRWLQPIPRNAGTWFAICIECLRMVWILLLECNTYWNAEVILNLKEELCVAMINGGILPIIGEIIITERDTYILVCNGSLCPLLFFHSFLFLIFFVLFLSSASWYLCLRLFLCMHVYIWRK